MQHLDEEILELYVLQSDAVRKRRKQIARHLRECKGCAALHKEIAEYYAQVEALQREQAARSSQALYAPEAAIRRRTMEDAAAVTAMPGTLPQRFVESFKRYPIRWSAGFAVVVAALALVTPKFSAVNQNPALARAEKEFLVVYNGEGKELWRKYIGMMIGDNALPDYVSVDSAHGFPVVDVDRDGKNEVFGVFGWANWNVQNNPWVNVLICFNSDGSERWRYELHREISIGGTPFSDDYRFYKLKVGDYDHNGSFEVIGWATHIPWFPSVTVILDAESGVFVSEYWHNGMVGYSVQDDIDRDGIDELVLGGQNNRFQQACLSVLDPREFTGSAPAPPEFTPDDVPPGHEQFYIVLPPSDLKPFWGDITNDVVGLRWKGDSTLEVVVREKITAALREKAKTPENEEGSIYFYFDRSMRCIQVRSSDGFNAVRAKYRLLGLVNGEIDSTYLEKLRLCVRYWDGEKFVSEPVMNKRYLEVRKELSQIQ